MCTKASLTGVVSRSAKTLLYTPGSTALPPFQVQGASSSWKPLRPEIGTMAKSYMFAYDFCKKRFECECVSVIACLLVLVIMLIVLVIMLSESVVVATNIC